MNCNKGYRFPMFGWLKNLKRKSWVSPSFNERRGQSPHIVIIHYTGMKTVQAALKRLCDPAVEVSAHYLIEEDGFVHSLVPEDKRAWHAGVSSWQGLSDLNSASIGIELVNTGHEFGYTEFPEKQMTALKKLLADIVVRHDIKPQHILGHSDIAPERKIDPGEKFDWRALASEGLGLWAEPQEMDYQAAEDIILNDGAFLELLGAYGYDVSVEPKALISAYHRHFYPEKFLGDNNAEEIDVLSVARLLSLVRQAHEAGG